MRGTLARSALIAALVIALLVGALVVFQRSLIYFPDRSPAAPAATVVPGGRDVTLHTDDGLELSAWLLEPADADDQQVAVLYAPGNGGNRDGRVQLLGELVDRGFTVLALEYRGYGGNPGSPSEDGLAADARAAAELLREEGFAPEQTLYLGESLGTGVVTRLATTHPPAGVLLRSPFSSLVDVGRVHYRWLPVRTLLRDRYPIIDLMPQVQVPVTVVRGSNDQVVPDEMSAAVAEAAPVLVEDLALPGVGHNDAEMFGAPVADALQRLVAHSAGERPSDVD